MDTAKIFQNGRSQAVRLPKECRFPSNTDEVLVRRLGKAVLLVPKEAAWDTFMEGLQGFSDDIFAGGRQQGSQQVREFL